MLNAHTDVTFLHIYTKTQPNATFTSPVIVKYVKHKYAYQIWHICQIFDMHLCGMYVYICGTYGACALKTIPYKLVQTSMQTSDGDCYRLNFTFPNHSISLA